MSDCIPCKEILIRPNDKPWFDSTIRRCIKYKIRKRNIALRKQTPTSWLKYRRLRNKVKNLKKYANKLFFENIETNIESDSVQNRQLLEIIETTNDKLQRS